MIILVKMHNEQKWVLCNAEVGREDIFKPTIGNESLHEISYDNWTYEGSFKKMVYISFWTSIEIVRAV
jgi:hypothetical protein